MFMWKERLCTIDAVCYRVNFFLMLEAAGCNRGITFTKCYNGIMWVINLQIFKLAHLTTKFRVVVPAMN